MRKRMGTLMVAVLLLAAILGGCAGDGGQSTPSDSVISGDSSAGESSIELPKFDISGTKVRYLGWGSAKDWTTEGTDAYESNEKLKKYYGAEIEFVRTTYDELPTKLAQLVLADTAPDLVHYKYQDNPNFILNDLVQEITPDLIDFDSPLWSGVKEVNQEYAFNGKIFTPVIHLINDGYVYYNVQMFEEAGLETPLELYRRGEWTWDTMRDLAEQLTVKGSDGTVKVYGMSTGLEYFYLTCGRDFVTVGENDQLTNNLSDANLAKVMNYVYRTGTAGSNCRMMIGQFQQEFLAGNIAMLNDEAWVRSMMYDKLKSGEVRFAPSPKMPDADQYYVNSLIEAKWIANKAPNPQGAAAYLAIARYMITDPEKARETREAEREKMGYTEEEYALIDEMNDTSKFTFMRRVGPGVGNFGNVEMYSMMNAVHSWDVPWSTCVEQYKPLLQAEIDAYNEKVAAYKQR